MQMCAESENHHFHIYFFNMDISLIIALICMKTCIIFPSTIQMEGCLKIWIEGLVFVLLYVEDGN